MASERPLGFDSMVEEQDRSSAEYTVQFSPADTPKAQVELEEIGLLGSGDLGQENAGKTSPTLSDAEKQQKEETVMFDDGVTSIDFILAYQDNVKAKKGKEDTSEKKDKRQTKRNTFIANCEKAGLVFEHQDCSDSPDQKTHFLKVHGTHIALLKNSEDMLLRMPIRENNLRVHSWRESVFDFIKIKDPFDPNIPRHLKRTSYFSAPFKYERRKNFIGWDDEKNFFTTAQRSSIVHYIMLNTRYGEEDDQVGLLRMLQNNSFSAGFPLHESNNQLPEGQTDADMTDRHFLYHRWSNWRNWYKRQPLDQIRRYYGEKVGIYFTWLGFYTSWLLPVSILGIIVIIYGMTRITNPIASDICDESQRYEHYMCPRCDKRCDFWFLTESCAFSRLTLIFDNGATVFFAVVMSFWAVLFLEFWKRRQYFLQYDWDVLGYEDSEQRARPEFEQRIKRYIRRCKTEDAKKKFYVHNPVLDKREYIQPNFWFFPKLLSTFSILITMVAVVIAIVFAVILYRLAIAGVIYGAVSGEPFGPSVGDIAVAVTGAGIQLIAIIIMNKLYEFLAYRLTNWELHRTQTDYDDSFITKMYFFQFVNFYSSLFYIAFFKGNLTGSPGGYSRISGLRVDECATYGCLLELTIQLAIIMIGKQILNNVQELAIPYVKRLINWFKHKDEEESAIYARWEKDYDLIPLNQHGLFFEYLELVIQYGFITIFVAAFPLAPLFALLNNWVEIRLDAHKFVVILRRPIGERAGDIGAWFGILSVVSQMAVVTNAFLIAVTAQFVPIETYTRGGYRSVNDSGLSGYLRWSLTEFTVDKLLDGRAFPAFSALELQLYDEDGDILGAADNPALYLPYVNFDCLMEKDPNFLTSLEDFNGTSFGINYQTITKDNFKKLFVSDDFNGPLRNYILVAGSSSSSPSRVPGECFVNDTTCRFRGSVDDGGFDDSNRDAEGLPEAVTIFGIRYWHIQTARLAFVIVFEHFIFVISAFLAWLVPDVPQSVKNEIQREKLLAYEAIHARKEQSLEDAEEQQGESITTNI